MQDQCGAKILYTLSVDQGCLKPCQAIEIVLTTVTRELGEQMEFLECLSLGSTCPKTCCSITCCGEGPVVNVEPAILNFGEIKLLKEKILELKLINESPTYAQYSASFVRAC